MRGWVGLAHPEVVSHCLAAVLQNFIAYLISSSIGIFFCHVGPQGFQNLILRLNLVILLQITNLILHDVSQTLENATSFTYTEGVFNDLSVCFEKKLALLLRISMLVIQLIQPGT